MRPPISLKKLGAKAQREVDEFNRVHAVGTAVRIWPGARDGRSIDTRTRTKALVLGGHSAVVWAEALSSCITLSHVEVIEA